MRLAHFPLILLPLIGALLAAQTPNRLPWENPSPVPWQQTPFQDEPLPLGGMPVGSALFVDMGDEGTLRITDVRGVVLMRMGLPGRPLRVWRDGGRPLYPPVGRWSFPDHTPLQGGIGSLLWGSKDFRPALEGLLWILDDGEHVITVVHPATRQVVFLPLPGMVDTRLIFHPDHLEVREMPPIKAERTSERWEGRAWSVPWLGLLPHFALLAHSSGNTKPGTALNPYPGE